MKKLVIIGSGLAGYNLVKEIRKQNKDIPITVITADNGNYYSKPQISTALSNGKTADDLIIASPEKLIEQLDIQLINNTKVKYINPNKKTIGCGKIQEASYDNLVLACGAKVKKINIDGDANEQIFSINSLEDYAKFRNRLINKRHVTIMGSGLVGCELANDLIRGGFKVDVVSTAHLPLDNLLPEKASNLLLERLSKQGVTWHLNTGVERIESAHSDQLRVKLNSGNQLLTDIVISAIGIVPNTELAKDAGLTVNRGIVTDEYLQTSCADIYALGDCVEICGHVYQHILPINQAVKALAQTITNAPTKIRLPAVPINIKTTDCPITVAPGISQQGIWNVEAAGSHIKARYIEPDGSISGFVLTGDRLKQRLEMTMLLPAII